MELNLQIDESSILFLKRTENIKTCCNKNFIAVQDKNKSNGFALIETTEQVFFFLADRLFPYEHIVQCKGNFVRSIFTDSIG